MNEQLSSALADILKAGKDGVVNIALYAQQQAPDLARQVVSWGFWIGVFWCVSSPIIICAIWVFFRWMKEKLKDVPDNEDVLIPLFMISGAVTVVFIVVFFSEAENIVQCLIAPKLYLIEYFKQFVK